MPDADLRNVTIFADAEVDRSPCGTGTCAVLAVLDAMGVLPVRLTVRAREHHRDAVRGADRSAHDGRRDCAPSCRELTGSASITGEHVFLIDDEDPLREGFRL